VDQRASPLRQKQGDILLRQQENPCDTSECFGGLSDRFDQAMLRAEIPNTCQRAAHLACRHTYAHQTACKIVIWMMDVSHVPCVQSQKTTTVSFDGAKYPVDLALPAR
jgi:hypothetical protein